MKTIEERLLEKSTEVAKEWVYDTHETGFWRVDVIREGYFRSGAEWMREEMTRWHDPIEESPEPYKVVEVKYRSSGITRISTAWVAPGDAGGYDWTIDGTNRTINRTKVIGWREIHE